MTRSNPYILYIVIAFLISSCQKAPRELIGESDMVDLLVDIHKAEALIEIDPKDYSSDSMKMVLKQSVFMKHDVTAEKFDASMAWYSKNMTVYNDVYEKVQKRLDDAQAELDRKNGKVVSTAHRHGQGRSYKDFGDTADIWKNSRQLVLTANLGNSTYPFVYLANQDCQQGDKYSLQFKMFNNAIVKSLVGVEYVDGSVTLLERRAQSEGWNELSLQTDSLKKIKSVFGYIKFSSRELRKVSFVDSIMLLRTHFDRNSYDLINTQKVLDRNKQIEEEKKLTMEVAGEVAGEKSAGEIKNEGSVRVIPAKDGKKKRLLQIDNNKPHASRSVQPPVKRGGNS